jgi:inorganic pyrophosphatase
MNHPWHDIDPGDPKSPLAFIEIPRGTKTKYELHKESGFMVADRVMYSAFVYPFNYGFIPRTLARDADPMDCFVMGEELLPMTMVRIRPVGLLRMSDEGKMDDKLLAVPLRDPRFEHVNGLGDVGPHYLRELEHFLSHYKDLEKKATVVVDWVDRDAAVREIEQSFVSYSQSAAGNRTR